MKTFISLQKSIVVCSILLFALVFILTAIADLIISEGELLKEEGGSDWKRFIVLDANDYDTCRSKLIFNIGTGIDYWFIPYVTGSAFAYVRSEQTDTDGNVSKGRIMCWAMANDSGDFPNSKEYTGSDSGSAYKPGTKWFTSDYNDLSLSASGSISHQDGFTWASASW
jgi:hypothetical protein